MTPAKPCRWASTATWAAALVIVALIWMGVAEAVEYIVNAWRVK
jgi:hypothetical protein